MGYGAGEREGHAHLANLHPDPHLREASHRACRKALATAIDSKTPSLAIRELEGGGWVVEMGGCVTGWAHLLEKSGSVSRSQAYIAFNPRFSGQSVTKNLPCCQQPFARLSPRNHDSL